MDNHNNERKSHDSFYLRQNELAQKSISLQVLHDHLKVNKTLCDERKRIVEEEMKALDEIHSKVWNLQNKICNQVWDFSTKHDQSEIIRDYPDLSELHALCECERKTDVLLKENVEVEKLALEIRNLESNLESVNCESLQTELRVAEKELRACEKESPENESLKKQITACEERISSLRLRLGEEYKRIESAPIQCSKNNAETNFKNLIQTSDESPMLFAPQTTLDASKNICSLSARPAPDRGGFVTASTFLSTTENSVSFPKISYKKVVTETVPSQKLSLLDNPPKKTFVFKTKTNFSKTITDKTFLEKKTFT